MDKLLLPAMGKHVFTIPQDSIFEVREPKEGKTLSVDLLLQEGAQVTYVTGTVQELTLRVVLHGSSQFTQTFALHKAEQRTQIFVMRAKQAQVIVNGSYHIKQGQGSFAVLQLHEAPCTTSAVTVKTVLDGTAEFKYEGTIKIEQQAHNTKAHQENKNLIISNQAKAFSVPNLEALNNNVECGHGSAISYINQDHLFYLSSRGIALEQAKKMIIQGFLIF